MRGLQAGPFLRMLAFAVMQQYTDVGQITVMQQYTVVGQVLKVWSMPDHSDATIHSRWSGDWDTPSPLRRAGVHRSSKGGTRSSSQVNLTGEGQTVKAAAVDNEGPVGNV
eukprot:1160143-Pelagomonas_calceolata.AAC.10